MTTAEIVWKIWTMMALLFIALVTFLTYQMVTPPPCGASGCFGGMCTTSAACVAGCHCINGRCG